jgi:hypothetical protein
LSVGRDCAEATRLSREALRQRTDFVGAHRVLTASLGLAGGADADKAPLEGLPRAQPNISLVWLASGLSFEHEADRAHYLEEFRRAGLGRGQPRRYPAGRWSLTNESVRLRPPLI